MGVNTLKLSLCVLLVISVLWKPVYSDHCSLACKGSPKTPTFLNGHKYTYGVEGVVSIYLNGPDKQETDVKLLGQATVLALGNCVNELQVQNLAISGPDGKKFGSPPGLEKPIRFTLEDGRVGPQICAEDGDSRRSLNIKRAIVSLLQTENKPSTQTDIFGSCPTEVTSSQEGGSLLVHRTRDLSRCAHREQGKNALVTAVYNPNAEIKSTQVLQSILNVESKVNNGIPEKVLATEEYLYRPFSVGDNGAKARVNTKLTLTGKAGGASSTSKCAHPRTIIFENPHSAHPTGGADNVLKIIKATAAAVQKEASSKSAGIFAELVRALRKVKKEDLLAVFNQVKGNQLEKRVFLDGLLRAGSGHSLAASIELVKTKQLSPLEQQLAFLSLGNARHVDSESVQAAASLLDMPNLPKDVYLGVGALAGAYCRDHECHHTKNDGITALSQKLAAKINCRPKGKIEEDTVIAVLKGTRNIRHLEDNLIDKIVRCATDNAAKARVRVAALEAFAADPCSPKLKKTALDILKNRNLDSEIRIKGYLAVIECPCAGSANEIKNLLRTEPVHQVGRFITTSLRHIKASSNPDKYLARMHYGQIGYPCHFNVDDRKYSFYREASYNIDALGLGGTAESTVIYSQDSFLPRSASLNLTAEVFGHSFNVFEIGGRQGNLDRVVEHFLGPKSFLRTQKPQDIYDNLVKKFKETEKKVEDKLSRGRRSVKTEVDNFDKHLKTESAPYNNELDLDLYLKLFGTDAVFLSLGDDKGFDFNAYLEKFLKVVSSGINDIKRFQQDVRANILFLDAEFAYPTSTGLPLKLDLVGSATGRVEVGTNVDVRQIYKNPKNAKIDIKLVPSSNIEIAGSFLVDAEAVATGIKVVANLHSSTGGHLIAKVIEDGNGIDIQFGLPIDKQEIIVASNDVLIFTAVEGEREKNVPVKLTTDRKEYAACFDQLAGVLGLTLCADASVPFSVSGSDAQASIAKFVSHLPLTRAAVKVTLEKNDLRGYHVKGIFRNDYPKRQAFEFLFEAEGSKNRRTSLSGEWVNTDEEKSAKIYMESPIKSASALAAYYNKPDGRLVELKALIDKDEYSAKAGFQIQGGGNRRVFKPILEYKMAPGDKQSVKIDGQLIEETNGPSRKYSLEGLKVHIPSSQEVIDVNGHFIQEPKKIDLDLKAKKGDHNLILSASIGDRVKIDFQNTLNPYVNFKLDGRFENTEGSYHNDLDLIYGPDFRDKRNRVTFQQLLKYHKKSTIEFDVITKNKFEIHALPFKIELNAEVDPKKVDAKFEGLYTDRKVEFKVDGRSQIKRPGDYSVKLYGEVDKRGIEVFSKRDIVSADKSNFENYISLINIAKYELSGVVLHKTKTNDLNVGAIGHFKISGNGKNEEFKFDVGAVENPGLCSSRAKISSSKGDILDYFAKIQKGANANGQLKFILKDAIAANGQYKVTDSNGQGNGMIIVDFKKSQRKIKGDVKFTANNPVYNMELDVFLNFEKDNNDKIHISTVSKISEKLVDAKNKIEYAGKRAELNYHRDAPTPNKAKSDFEVILPSERQLSLKVEHDFDEKDDTVNGYINLVLSDATKRGGAASVLGFKTKLVNTNVERDNIDIEGQLDLKLKDGRDLQNTFVIKNIPGEKNKFDFKADVKGSLIPKPASLVASEESTEASHLESKYRVKGNYGDDIGFELEGSLYDSDLTAVSSINRIVFCPKCCKNFFSFETDKPSGKVKPYKLQDDNTLTIRLPFEKAHDIKYTSNLLLVRPEQGGEIAAEFTFLESLQINADLYKVEGNGKFVAKHDFDQLSFNGKTKVLVPHNDPFGVEVTLNTDSTGDKERLTINSVALYGKGKKADLKLDGQAAPGFFQVEVIGNSPQAEKLKKFEFRATSTLQNERYELKAGVKADNFEENIEIKTITSKVNPELDFIYNAPSRGPPMRIYIKGIGLSSSEGTIDYKFENIKDISLSGKTQAKILRDNVEIKMVANSEKLNLKNYIVEITSKDVGSSKRLEFQCTNDGKNVFSGSTSFISKQEGPKSIIEGSGSVKVKEEQKSANFKYIRTMLTEGHEQGVETFLDLTIGERSYVAEYRVTNLEYKNSYVYCEEKKQCANIELQSKINMPHPGTFKHIFNVIFDLRKLGFAPEFGLQVTSEVSEKKLPQYALDLHVNKEDKKYYLHVYSQPEHGKLPAGITVTLPHRVLALESVITYPTNKAQPFPIKGEVALYTDKNKPQLKTAAWFVIDSSGSDMEQSFQGEAGFTHPKFQGKKALIKFGESITRIAENSIKFESNYHIELLTGETRNMKLFLEADPIHVKLLLECPVGKVIDLESSATVKDNLQRVDFKFNLLQGNPVEAHVLLKDYQYFEFSTGYSDQAERRFTVVGHLEPEKRVDLSADLFLQKDKKNIAHGALFLQDNLIRSDYGFSRENFGYFVGALQNDFENLGHRIGAHADNTSKDLKQTFDKQVELAKQAAENVNKELESTFKDIAQDPTIPEFIEAIEKISGFIYKIIDEVLTATKPIIDSINKTFEQIGEAIHDNYKEKLQPQLEKLKENFSAILREYLEALIEVYSHFSALVKDFIEKHKPELQELTNTLAEIFKDVTRLVVAQIKEIRSRLAEIVESIIHDIKEMPFLAVLKEKWQELEVPEQALTMLREVHGFIHGLLPTKEMGDFCDALYGYIETKLKQQKVDDNAQLRVIYEKLVIAITSLVQLVRQQTGQYGVPTYTGFNAASFISGPSQVPPTFFGGVPTFSFLMQILSGEIANPIALLQAYRPRSLNPLDEVPAKLRAVVVNGQHIFTFDGRHMTFPGSCRYVLAHDTVDKNFTLVMQLQAGQPKALILQEKSGNSVELKANGQAAYNGAAHPFPVIEKDIFAFRDAFGRIGLGSEYGVMAFCSSKLEVCYIEVNGFYLGKLRGLLGDGNNEPYDDFRMPNGKITKSESEFGHSYRLSTSCPPVETPNHSHDQLRHLPKVCEEVFGGTSPLKFVDFLMDNAPFKQACAHIEKSADPKKEACDLARGYTALAVNTLIPAFVPTQCVQCTDGDTPRKVGESFEVKLPNKKADIVVNVEVTKPNEKNYVNLVVPLVSQIVDQLKSKQITDIKVFLVGITPKMPYPIIYDTDVKLKSPKVKFDDESRYILTPRVKTGNEKFDHYEDVILSTFDAIIIKLGLTNVVAAYTSELELPLRPGAVKHSIAVVGGDCVSALPGVDILRNLAYSTLFKEMTFSHTLVKNVHNLKIGGGKDPKQVVGFTRHSVLLLGDKALNKDTDSLAHTIEHDYLDDACIDFAKSTGGLVLLASNYHDLDPGSQKRFLQTASSAIVTRLLGVSVEQKCTCHYVDPFTVRSTCVRTGEHPIKAGSRRK